MYDSHNVLIYLFVHDPSFLASYLTKLLVILLLTPHAFFTMQDFSFPSQTVMFHIHLTLYVLSPYLRYPSVLSL